MKQLLFRADDLGYSYAVNLGIERSARDGFVRSVGLMPNMPEAQRGFDWVSDLDIALGQHSNVCLGTPCADPALIPSLLGPDGRFRSSREYREASSRGGDFVRFDEAVVELLAQLERFRDITGRDPDYFEAHAVASPTLMDAVSHVARENGLKEQPFSLSTTVCGSTEVRMVMESGAPDYDPRSVVRRVYAEMADGETAIFVGHPGYLDDYILQTSSLTTNRTKEVDMFVDREFRTWLEELGDLRLVDYRQL